MDLTVVASATHNLGIATEFADNDSANYMLVVHASALPIRPLSMHPWEDESLLAPQVLRCVHVDHAGAATGGIPAAYLVDEDLVVLAQQRAAAAVSRTLSVEVVA